MDIDEVKRIVDRMVFKKEEVKRLSALKDFIDNRTSNGEVEIKIEDRAIKVSPVELKKLVDFRIADQDTKTDEVELKQKIK